MKVVFFGTPEYVLPILENLHKRSEVVAVVTQTPKPADRDKKLTYTAVDSWAFKHKIPVIYDLNKVSRADLGILAAYGKIIPEFLTANFKFGILNIHPSLLPKLRGASPVQAAIIEGLEQTGVTVIKLDNEVDHGPIVSSFKEKIATEDTTGILRQRLFARSSQFLIDLIPPYINGKITPQDQNHKEATFTTQVKKEDGFIPPEYFATTLRGASFKGIKCKWEIPFMNNYELDITPASMNRFIRAMSLWPGAWTLLRPAERGFEGQALKRLKILKSHLELKTPINHKSYILIPDEVQLEGKNPVSWEEFKRGYPSAIFKSD